MKIIELNISARARHCLIAAGYEHLSELRYLSDEELLSIRNFNQSCLNEIRSSIAEYFMEEDFPMIDDRMFLDPVEPSALEMTIEELDLSVRSYNCLKRAGILTVEELCNRTIEDMMKVRNLGKKSLDEICHKLEELGLSLKLSEEVVDDDSEAEDILSQAQELKELLENCAMSLFKAAVNESEEFSEVYTNFMAYIAVGNIEKAFEYFCTEVENGYKGNYSIIPSYFLVGYEGVGGGEYEKALIWTTRFYNDYLAGILEIEDDYEFGQATHEYNLGVLNFMFNDSIGDEKIGIEYWKKCIEHTTSKSNDLSTIAMGMLGANMNLYNTQVRVDCDMQMVIDAIQKDASLGNFSAIQILDHIKRDGYNLQDVEKLSEALNDNEQSYILALYFLYEYGDLRGRVDEAQEWFEDTFESDNGFDYDEYMEKHCSDDTITEDEDEELFEDMEIFEEDGLSVEFCGIDFNDAGDSLTLKFWAWNHSGQDIKLWLHNLEINAEQQESIEYLSSIEDGNSEFIYYNISELEEIHYYDIENIEFSIEIDNIKNKELFETQRLCIECDAILEKFSVEILDEQVSYE